jgi:hypothetical protein
MQPGFGEHSMEPTRSVVSRLNETLLPVFEARFDAGETLDFGSICLSRDTISIRDGFGQWTSAPATEVRGFQRLQGVFKVSRDRAKGTFPGVNHTTVVNPALCEMFLKQVMRITAPPADAVTTASAAH